MIRQPILGSRCLEDRVHLLIALLVWTGLWGCMEGRAAGSDGVVLSPKQAVWKYLDTGTNADSDWNQPRFDDSAWASGPAPLGYDPKSPVATVVSYGPDPQRKHITTWFRRTFSVTNAVHHQRLLLRVMRDDGIVVYLNGREVFRNNMPSGEVASETLAAVGVEEDLAYHPVDFPFRLENGTHVLAAEVHQWNPTSSDLWFDAELVSPIVRGPYLQQATAGSMLIRWRTPLPTAGFVQFGTDTNQPGHQVGHSSPMVDHAILLTNLMPDTRYFYRVGAYGQIIASGPELFFRTAPVKPRPTRIWVLGDSGTGNWGQLWAGMVWSVRDAYLRFAGTRPTDVWLMLGDNAYYEGHDREYQTAMFDVYQTLLTCTPVWSTLGNHEAYSLSPDGRLAYYDIFSPPTLGEAGGVASGTKKYYSFNHGHIHFVCLDSMLSDRTTNGPMWAWLAQDLAANTNEWLIAFWHHPPYSKGNHDSDNPDNLDPELSEMRVNFLPLLEAYGVDLVLSGHCHTYERSHLLSGHYGHSATLNPWMLKDAGSGRPEDTGPYRKEGTGPTPHQGTVYVVAGSAGSTTGGNLDHPAMFISLNELGSLVLDVDENRLDARFLRETGAIEDHFTILKGAPPATLQLVASRRAGDALTLRWKSEAGRIYRVEQSSQPVSLQWKQVSPPINAHGATTSWTTSLQGMSFPTFFRIAAIGSF